MSKFNAWTMSHAEVDKYGINKWKHSCLLCCRVAVPIAIYIAVGTALCVCMCVCVHECYLTTPNSDEHW